MRYFQLLAAALCALACASGAAAAAASITHPDWQSRPTAQDMERFYPASAQLLNIEGKATISCDVTAVGMLESCTVVTETPAGFGFGSAALALGPIFRMKPMLAEGRPVAGGVVRIPISFKLPPAPAAPQVSTDGISPRALELAREATKLSGGDLKELVDAKISAIQAVGRAQSSGAATPEQEKDVRDAAVALAGEWETARAVQWARLLSEQELASLVEFAKSGQGAALIKKNREMRWRLVGAHMTALARFQSRARDVFCSKTSCTPYPDAADLAALENAKVDLATPRWTASPTKPQITRAAPKLASAMQLPGWALMHCTVSAIGSPRDCVVVGEKPKGVGFGQAARGLADGYVLHPDLMKEGGAGKRVALFVPFTMAPFPLPPQQISQFDPQKLTLAGKLIATQKMKTELAPALLRMTGGDKNARPAPGLEPDVRRELMAAMGAGAEAAVAEASDMIRTFYAENFTLEELQALLRLQETSGGRAMEAVSPKLAEAEASLCKAFLDKVGKAAGEAYCRRHGCMTPDADKLRTTASLSQSP